MHPMYKRCDGDSLRQGDILDASLVRDELRGHLEYFAEKKHFVAFCVVSQSCDLERDRRVDFVTLAVVREITHAFSHHHIPENAKKTRDLLTSIISHNWNKRAYFYVHPNLDATIQTPCVADLRVCFSVSIHDEEHHYNKLVAARRASMSDGYAAALGAMAAQVFGRVATPDWADHKLQPPTAEEYVEKLWKSVSDARNENPQP